MTATLEDIKGWFRQAEGKGATHLIVVCDTFDHDNYPVFVLPHENVRDRQAEYSGKNMQRVEEVYKISLGWDAQKSHTLGQRIFNY